MSAFHGQPRRPAQSEFPIDPVDRLLAENPKLVHLGALIRRHRQQLRTVCSDEAWNVFVTLEELMVERAYTLVDLVIAPGAKR